MLRIGFGAKFQPKVKRFWTICFAILPNTLLPLNTKQKILVKLSSKQVRTVFVHFALFNSNHRCYDSRRTKQR
jgi:hypothetical protein